MDIQIDRDKKREDGKREGDERRDRENNGEGGVGNFIAGCSFSATPITCHQARMHSESCQ